MARIHCSGSNCVGAKTFGPAVPSPHSRSRNVFVPKWMMTLNSRSCHSICRGDGLTSEKFWAAAGVETRARIRTKRDKRLRAGLGLRSNEADKLPTNREFDHKSSANAQHSASRTRVSTSRRENRSIGPGTKPWPARSIGPNSGGAPESAPCKSCGSPDSRELPRTPLPAWSRSRW